MIVYGLIIAIWIAASLASILIYESVTGVVVSSVIAMLANICNLFWGLRN